MRLSGNFDCAAIKSIRSPIYRFHRALLHLYLKIGSLSLDVKIKQGTFGTSINKQITFCVQLEEVVKEVKY